MHTTHDIYHKMILFSLVVFVWLLQAKRSMFEIKCNFIQFHEERKILFSMVTVDWCQDSKKFDESEKFDWNQ